MPVHPDEWACFVGLQVSPGAEALEAARCIGYGPTVISEMFHARYLRLA
jgi:hypothetical protein